MVVGEGTIETQLAIVGSGSGGYAAAFRAADMGMDVTLIDVEERPGGVCLFRGCIPSKALLHATELIQDTRRAGRMGITFQAPEIDLDALRKWKDGVVDRLADGMVTLSKKREVQLVHGRATFQSSQELRVRGSETMRIQFEHAILATGSQPIALPDTVIHDGGRVMDSAGALELPDVPQSLLVVGAGYIGMELGSVYAALGSKVTVVELTGEILPGTDRDLVRPLERRVRETFEAIHLNTQVVELEEKEDHVVVTLEGEVDQGQQTFDRVLVAIGRKPNSTDVGLENTAVEVDEQGFVQVDVQRRTADERIFAIGDVVGGKMLAHKAMYEGKVAAEVIAGEPSAFDARAVPAVVYTDPTIAWAGLMEHKAREMDREVQVARFPWRASGRALTMNASEGLTKVVFEPGTERILGVGIVGREAGELIAEAVLAIEMGAVATDVALSIHPHPTLSETIEESAASVLGHPTHILPRG